MHWQLRAVLCIVTWEAAFAAVLLWDLRAEEAFMPLLWPALFAVGAAGTAVLVAAPWHPWAATVSAVGLVCGHAGRSLAVAANLTAGTVLVSSSRAWLAAAVYGVTAALIGFAWVHVVAPMVVLNQRARRLRDEEGIRVDLR